MVGCGIGGIELTMVEALPRARVKKLLSFSRSAGQQSRKWMTNNQQRVVIRPLYPPSLSLSFLFQIVLYIAYYVTAERNFSSSITNEIYIYRL